MRKSGIFAVLGALWLCASGSIAAQTVTTLFRFDGLDGAQPAAGLVQGADGNLYAATQRTLFKITPSGTLTTLSGGESMGALILATDGNFYGTNYEGGANGAGSVFKITPRTVCENRACLWRRGSDDQHSGEQSDRRL